jgi:hypothetical protein
MAAIAIEGIHDGLGEIEVTVELVPGDFRMMFALSPHEGGHVDLFLSLEETARLATYAAMATEHAIRGHGEELGNAWITEPVAS